MVPYIFIIVIIIEFQNITKISELDIELKMRGKRIKKCLMRINHRVVVEYKKEEWSNTDFHRL